MPKGIARQNIAGRASIARKPIASVYATQSEQTAATSPQQFPPGSYTFTPTVSGWWKFVLWGGGGEDNAATNGGGSCGYCEITKFLTTAQTVALVVGVGARNAVVGTASSATFPDATVVTAGAASGRNGGTATGGDVNLAGSLGGDGSVGGNGAAGLGTGGGLGGAGATGSRGGGAGAPANLPFRGGDGGTAGGGGNPGGRSPGSGYAAAVSNAQSGGDGLVIAFLARS